MADKATGRGKSMAVGAGISAVKEQADDEDGDSGIGSMGLGAGLAVVKSNLDDSEDD